MGQIPSSDRLYKYVTANFTVRFRPGGVQTDFTFTEWADLVEFILNNREAVVGVIIDLSLIGGSFSVPAGTYNLNGLRLVGTRDPVTGLRPQLQLPDGFFVDPLTTEIFALDLDLVVTSNSNPIYTPTGTTRITFETSILTQLGGAPFIVIPSGNTDSNPNMFLNDESILFGPAVAPLVLVESGESYTIASDDICVIGENTLQYEDDTSLITILASVNSVIGAQTLLAGGTLNIVGPEQNVPLAEVEVTYPGKIVKNSPDDDLYFRDQGNDDWVRLANFDDVPFNFLSLTDTPVSYNTFAGYDLTVNDAGDGIQFRSRFDGFFLGLFDTPGSYAGQAGRFVKVNNAEDTLQFDFIRFSELEDTPASYTGFAGYTVKVNNAEDGVEFTLNNFLGLEDTPASFAGAGSQVLIVNGTEDGIEFIDNSFADLVDTPAGLVADQWLRVNPAGTALEFFTPSILELPDTPIDFTGFGGYTVTVKGTEDGVEFTDFTFLELKDTPSDYTGLAGYGVRVNPGETGLEFVPLNKGFVWAYEEDNAAITSTTTINVWVKANLSPTAPELDLFSHDGTGVFTYTGTEPRKFILTAHISFLSSGNDKNFEFSWFRGGVAGTRLNGKVRADGHSDKYYGNAAPRAVVELSNGQNVSLAVRNIEGTDTATLVDVNYIIEEVE